MVQRKPLSDLVGKTFNRLTVVDYLGKRKHGKHWWLCSCSCGGSVELNTSRITGNDATKSCGCLRKDAAQARTEYPVKHGLHKHPLYAIFSNMKSRCNNPNSQRWKYYGAKGVKVLWEFEDFYKWSLENGWESGLSIDRIDPNGNYEPSNCEWVSVSENSRRMNEFKRNESTAT